MSKTREVYLFGRWSYVSQLKFYVLIGSGKLSARDWPRETEKVIGRCATMIILTTTLYNHYEIVYIVN